MHTFDLTTQTHSLTFILITSNTTRLSGENTLGLKLLINLILILLFGKSFTPIGLNMQPHMLPICAHQHVVLSIRSPILRSSLHQNSTKNSWTFWPLMMGPICCPKSSVQNYHSTLRNIREERRSHLHRGKGLKSPILQFCFVGVTCWFTTYIHFFSWSCFDAVVCYFDRISFPPWEGNTTKMSHHSVRISPYHTLSPKMDPYSLYPVP